LFGWCLQANHQLFNPHYHNIGNEDALVLTFLNDRATNFDLGVHTVGHRARQL